LTRFKTALNSRDGVAIVAGTVIGSGVFLVPGSVARQIPSVGLMLGLWLVGGLLTLFGALSVAELGAAYPRAGGLYVYLKAAYGRPLAFLYGWGLLTLIHSGSLATLAVAFAVYLDQLIPLSGAQQKLVASAAIAFVTVVNYLGLRTGKGVQNLVTACKVGGIAALVIALFAAGTLHRSVSAPAGAGSIAPLSIGTAMVAILWAYEGWHVVSFTAGEFHNPQRDLPRSLTWGVLLVVAIYLLANLAYFAVLSPAQVQATDRAAATAMSTAYGVSAAGLVTVLIVVSIFGAMNGTALTGPRVYCAMAKDGLFFPAFARLDPRTGAPGLAILVQGVWSCLLTLAGSFQELFTYVIFTSWMFYGATVLGVLVQRVRRPELPRPYRVPAYPWIPVLFVLAAAFITVTTIVNRPRNAFYGIGLILLGLPFYWVSFRRSIADHE
jgi:APA family basic amino acid/polyamine antiporter